jgi:hypothetical protein
MAATSEPYSLNATANLTYSARSRMASAKSDHQSQRQQNGVIAE